MQKKKNVFYRNIKITNSYTAIKTQNTRSL